MSKVFNLNLMQVITLSIFALLIFILNVPGTIALRNILAASLLMILITNWAKAKISIKPVEEKSIFSGIKEVCETVYKRIKRKLYQFTYKSRTESNALVTDAGIQVAFTSNIESLSVNNLVKDGWEEAWLTEDLVRPQWVNKAALEVSRPPDKGK